MYNTKGGQDKLSVLIKILGGFGYDNTIRYRK